MIEKLLLLALLSGSAYADIQYTITFNPTSTTTRLDGDPYQPLDYVGTFTTDDTCSICTLTAHYDPAIGWIDDISGGLLTIVIDRPGDIESEAGFELGAFDNGNANMGTATYDRTSGLLSGHILDGALASYITLNSDGTYDSIYQDDILESGQFLWPSYQNRPRSSFWERSQSALG